MLLRPLLGWVIFAPPPDVVVSPSGGPDVAVVDLQGGHALQMREASRARAREDVAHAARREIEVFAHPEGLLVQVTWDLRGLGTPWSAEGDARAPLMLVRNLGAMRLLDAQLVGAGDKRRNDALGVARGDAGRRQVQAPVIYLEGGLALDVAQVMGRAGNQDVPARLRSSPRGTTGASGDGAERSRSLEAALGSDRRLRLTLLVPIEPGSAQIPLLDLLAASRGTLRVDPALPWELDANASGGARAPKVGATWWTGNASVALRPAQSATADRGELVLASIGQGVSLAEGEARYRTRIHLENRLGARDDFTIRLPDVGSDLQIAPNANVEVTRQGETLSVRRNAAGGSSVDLELSWTASITADRPIQIELPTVENVFKTESSLQISRDSDIEAAVQCGNCRLIAGRELPKWGKDLTTGSVLASYRDVRQASVEVVPFVALEEPPVFVDVAEYDAALSKEGRLILSIRYEVRNDRASGLTLSMPKGYRLLGVRVDGDTARLTQIDANTFRIPLPRSIESIEGLLTFPVEVSAIATDRRVWKRRQEQPIVVPTVDAPIAVARASVYLPRGYQTMAAQPDDGRVTAFSRGEGIAYGFARGDQRSALADQLYREAVKEYQSNNFAEVQTKLDELKELGASNDNLARLQGNVDVIEGRFDASAVDTRKQAAANRVRALAKAKGKDAELEQDRQLQLAREAERSGDFEQAERSYSQALELGGKLAQLEDDKNLDKGLENKELESRVLEVRSRRSRNENKKREAPARQGAFEGVSAAANGDGRFGNDWNQGPIGGDFANAPATTAETVTINSEDLKVLPSGTPSQDFITTPDAVDLAPAAASEPLPVQEYAEAEMVIEGSTLSGTATVTNASASRRTVSRAPRDTSRRSRVTQDSPQAYAGGVSYGVAGGRQRWRSGKSTGTRGGVVGGQIGGVVHAPPPATVPPPPPAPPPPPESPVTGTEEQVYLPAGDALSGLRYEDKPVEEVVDMDGDGVVLESRKIPSDLAREPLSVTASGLSVTIPSTGQGVLYQRLLLGAGEQPSLMIRAKKRRVRVRGEGRD